MQVSKLSGTDLSKHSRLISLGEASRILGVKEATLRHWSNRGLVKVVRTKGGHRRFNIDEIRSITHQSPAFSVAEARNLEEEALRRIRHRLRRGSQAQKFWRQGMPNGILRRFHIFGRRVLSLLIQSGSETRPRARVLEEARLLGHEHGMEMCAQTRSVVSTLSAYVFFRDCALDALPNEVRPQASVVADQIMFGVAEAYETVMQESKQ